MLRRFVSIFAVASLAVAAAPSLVAAADAAPAAAAVAPAEAAAGTSGYYPLQVGTEWEFTAAGKTFVSKVVKHELKGDIMTARVEMFADGISVGSENLAVTKDAIVRVAGADVIASKPTTVVKLPPKAGDKWKVDALVGTDKLEGDVQCDAIDEKVKVAAGEFATVKVTGSFVTTAATGEKRTIKVTTWYHDGTGPVKIVINAQGTDVLLDLKKFKPGP